jgi:uncharacterized membrane protein (UPF0182 family)
VALRSPAPPLLVKAAAFLIPAAILLGVAVPRLGVEWEWFGQFGFESVVLRRWLLQLSAFLVVMGLGIPLQLQQLQRCWNLRQRAGSKILPPDSLFRLNPGPLVAVQAVLLILLVGGLAFLEVQARGLIAAPFSGDVISGFPVFADLSPLLMVGLGAALLIPLLVWPLTTLRLLLGAALVGSATALARGWSLWVPALLAAPFGEGDPLTGFELSFTVLQLPAVKLLLSVLFAQATVGLAGCLWLTFTEGTTVSDLRFVGLSLEQKAVLQPQVAVLAVVAAISAALSPFDLMVQGSGVAAGAGFVDLHVRLPLRLLLSLLLLFTALGLVVPMRRHWLRRLILLPLVGTALLLPIAEFLVAPLVQRLWVEPRELLVETPYLTRSIRATRRAFGLERLREITLAPRQALTAADLAKAPGTLANIRLWDSRPLLAANRQLQQLRLYYSFPSAAVDRYLLGDPARITASQQVLIAAREIDPSALPTRSRTWLNRHLVFTHGYGFTVSPVNTFGSDGLPSFFVKDLGRNLRVQGNAALDISNASAKGAFPVGRPRLYYGSAPAPYAIAPTKVEEFDYPDGELNFWNHFEGELGVGLGNAWQRFKAAAYLGEPRVLFSGSFTPRSLLLLRRQVKERLRALAPFLGFESEPYLVTVELKDSPGHRPGQHQYWMLDGFTTSRSYPYSEANANGIRYFRNPVKAVVDAHDGRVWLYVSDASDPILRTWQRVFPELFRPLEAMPKPLLKHIRVPISQFSIQSERLLRYHVTDVRTFYNREDEWAVPSEIYDSKTVPVQPYHATLQLPGEVKPEFVLLLPFSPVKRSNLVGWLAARNDPPNYDQLVLVRFPQQRLLLGPEQITSLIAQDPQISLQFGLWGRVGGSQLVRGNILVLPVGEGLLYVEPIYLRSKSTNFPTLVRVVVTDGRRFVMERSLEVALARLVGLKDQESQGIAALEQAATPLNPAP